MSKYDISSLAHLKRREAHLRSLLLTEIRWLADDLCKAADYLEQGILPSSLGILQARGPGIDRLCGIVAELQKQREYMEAEQAQKEESVTQEGDGR